MENEESEDGGSSSCESLDKSLSVSGFSFPCGSIKKVALDNV